MIGSYPDNLGPGVKGLNPTARTRMRAAAAAAGAPAQMGMF